MKSNKLLDKAARLDFSNLPGTLPAVGGWSMPSRRGMPPPNPRRPLGP